MEHQKIYPPVSPLRWAFRSLLRRRIHQKPATATTKSTAIDRL